jgi:hypothetical protein
MWETEDKLETSDKEERVAVPGLSADKQRTPAVDLPLA